MVIFVDESGFTGNDLLNTDQPYFVLSSVSVSEADAQYLVEKTKKDFRIQANELKASQLLRTSRGRDAVNYILHNLQGRYALSCNDKSYNLCCKFFEYVFEPVLQRNNSIFYANNFHLFIANTIYLFSVNEDKAASEILVSFAKMMRELNFDGLRNFFSSTVSPGMPDDVFLPMVDFMEGFSDEIIEELEVLKITDDQGKWILDLSFSSLCSLLRHWAERHSELLVVCDPSKPLAALTDSLDVMIGRTDRPKINFPGKSQFSPIFNLKESIQFRDSKVSAGVQLADVLASSAVFALKQKDKGLLSMVEKGNIAESVFPTLENVDLSKKQPFVNCAVLLELGNRARNGYDPIDGMAEYYERIKREYDVSNNPTTSE